MSTATREVKRLTGNFRRLLADRGPRYVASDALDFATSYLAYPVGSRRRRGHTFRLGARDYPYFLHHYNRAWRNERAVELALAREFVERRRGTRMLEIGNVLAHYGVSGHEVLDKYEKFPGVINEDLADFAPADSYESIVSLSTLEHVGWDERPREPEKVLRACDNVRRMLGSGGELLFTVPLGYNPHCDRYVADGALPFEDVRFMRRVSRRNEWVEVAHDEIAGARYDHPFRKANALMVARIAPSA